MYIRRIKALQNFHALLCKLIVFLRTKNNILPQLLMIEEAFLCSMRLYVNSSATAIKANSMVLLMFINKLNCCRLNWSALFGQKDFIHFFLFYAFLICFIWIPWPSFLNNHFSHYVCLSKCAGKIRVIFSLWQFYKCFIFDRLCL